MRSYYRYEIIEDANEKNEAGNYRTSNSTATASKSFENKTKIIRRIPNNIRGLKAKAVAPLKYLNSFWGFLIYL